MPLFPRPAAIRNTAGAQFGWVHRRDMLALLAVPVVAAAAKPASVTGQRCRVTAWMSGDAGEALLDAAAIQASVQGQSAKVVAVRGPDSPLLLMVVLDLTGDMALIGPARDSLKQAVGELKPHDWVALMRAQDGLRVLADPEPARDALLAQLDTFETTGRAALLEAVQPAAALAERVLHRSPIRIAVLFLTDSNIYNYREDYTNPVVNPSDSRDLSRRFPEALVREKTARLAATLNAFDAPVFIQHLAWLRDPLNAAYQSGLQQVAEATGGSAAFSRAQADVPVDVAQMVQKIANHWAIDLELPAATPRTFSVLLAVAGREIQYRTKFTLAPHGKETKS